jgi:hypothetical protein
MAHAWLTRQDASFDVARELLTVEVAMREALAAVCLMGITAFLPACGDSPSGLSPSTSVASPPPASPSPPSTLALPSHTMTGVVMDAASHTAIAGARVEVVDASGGKAVLTDSTGAFSIAGLFIQTVYRVRISAIGYDAREQLVELSQDTTVNFELRPPVSTPASYAGVWGGVYQITDCHDLDVPGLIHLSLCPFRTQSYRFTLTQTGTLVSGTYTLESEFYSCACGVLGYGDFLMSGTVSPDGTLIASAIGSVRASGVTGKLDLSLRQASSTTISGTGTIHLRFGTLDDRSIGSVFIQSGTRVQ